MTWGFLVAKSSWQVIRESIGNEVDVSFVVHHHSALTSQLAEHHPDTLIVEARPEYLSPKVVSECDQRGILLAALITQPDGEQVADERGVGQRIRQPRDLATLTRPSRHSPFAGSADGLLCVVWGAQGSPGRSTMAVTLASALAGAGHSVMLVDADPRGGTIATMLGLLDEVPGFLASCRLASKKELDEGHIRRLRSVYTGAGSQFDVLTGVARMTRATEAPRDSVDAVLAQLQSLYSVVIIDPGSDLLSSDPLPGQQPGDQAGITSHLVSRAEHLVTVIEASPVGVVRFARAQLDLDALATDSRRHYWLNGVDPARKTLKDEAVLTEALWRYTGVESFVAIPRDDSAVRSAVMAAMTLVDRAGKQPILQALASEVASFSSLASSRSARQRSTVAEAVAVAEPAHTLARKSVALWHKLTALR